MSYQFTFDGVASAEVTRLLGAVERQLNLHAVRAQGGTDSGGVVASTPSGVDPCPPGQVCPDNTHGAHNPDFIMGVVAGLVVGLVIGYVLGRRSVSSSAKS